MEQAKKTHVAPDEYFAIEDASEIKSEYYHGEIFAMTGASFNHNLIVWNILAALHKPLKHTTCFAFPSDMKVQVDEDKHYTYPDNSIVCGDIKFVQDRDDTVKNPVAIIEVLSDFIQDYDRGSKFTSYRNISSLKDYILINQYACQVEYFHKIGGSKWEFDEYKSSEDIFTIKSVNVKLYLWI